MNCQIKGNLIIIGAHIYPNQTVRFFGQTVVRYELTAVKLLKIVWEYLFWLKSKKFIIWMNFLLCLTTCQLGQDLVNKGILVILTSHFQNLDKLNYL